jgi:hypothetical protein
MKPHRGYDVKVNPNASHLVSLISVTEHRLSALFFLVGSGTYAGMYVLVSSARTELGENEETRIFLCDEVGEPTSWDSLYRRLDFDQEEALKSFGYPVHKNT